MVARLQSHRAIGLGLFALAACLLATPTFADIVILRSGVQYTDVKARPTGSAHTLYFRDGSVRRIPNSQIQSVRPMPTTWSRPANSEPIPAPQSDLKRQPELPAPSATEAGSRENSILSEDATSAFELTPIYKSAILPGWGQYSEGRVASGAAYSLGSLFLWQRYWSLRQRHSVAEADYNDPWPTAAVAAQTLNGNLGVFEAVGINLLYLAQKEAAVFKLETEVNNTVFAISLLWAWNMLDIVFGGLPWERNWFSQQEAAAPLASWHIQLGADAAKFLVVFQL
jgi:hypothetical protein